MTVAIPGTLEQWHTYTSKRVRQTGVFILRVVSFCEFLALVSRLSTDLNNRRASEGRRIGKERSFYVGDGFL